jgi:hypothetical protein
VDAVNASDQSSVDTINAGLGPSSHDTSPTVRSTRARFALRPSPWLTLP